MRLDGFLEKIERRYLLGFCMVLSFLPRLPFAFRLAGHDVSEAFIVQGRTWIESGSYAPSKPPGSPVYEFVIMLVDWLMRGTGLPFYYYTNPISMISVAIALFALYRIFRRFLPRRASFLGIVLFNFQAHVLVMGGATTDINFLMMFAALAFAALLSGRDSLAIALSILAAGSRLQGVALMLPLMGAILWKYWKEREWAALLRNLGIATVLAVVIFYGPVTAYGPSWLVQPHHAGEFSRSQKLGALVSRAINLFGPLGAPFVLYAIWKRVRWIKERNPPAAFVAAATVGLTLAILTAAPWESFYFMPCMPILIFLVLKATLSRQALALFAASLLLPIAIQIRVHPWKIPPFSVKPGVLDRHLHESWIVRGGG